MRSARCPAAMLGALAAAFLLGFTAPSPAADAADEARAAAEALRASVAAMAEAGRGRDRVAALTRTIGAYERGLTVLRAAVRRTVLREAEIRAALDLGATQTARVLSAMAGLARVPGPPAVIHPDGPEAAARAELILGSVTPALEAEAAVLSSELSEIARLRRLRTEAVATLQEGLAAAQAARAALSQAIQDRTDLPRRFLEDPEELKELLASAETLDAFAGGIAAMEEDVGAPREAFAERRGALSLPVEGQLLRRAGEADAAGIRRPGMLIATRPGALVTTPAAATIRYRGPLLDYGNVMVLEPEEGYLMILAGLGTVFGETGDVLSAGAPVGLMPGEDISAEAILVDPGRADLAETLYIEIRQGDEPLDPAGWFAATAE